MKRNLIIFSTIFSLNMVLSWPSIAQQVPDDPYLESIQAVRKIDRGPAGTQSMEAFHYYPPKEEGHRLQIRVVSADTGKALPTVQVSLDSEDNLFSADLASDFVWPSWKTYQNIEEVASLENVPEGRFFLMVYSPGYIRHWQDIVVPHKEVVEIRLSPKKAQLNGRVIDILTQTPVAGAEITMSYQVGKHEAKDPDFVSISTGSDGKFQLVPLPGPGYPVTLLFSHEAYFPERRTLAATDAWKETLGDILLYPHASMEGRVLNEAGQPIKAQPVYVLDEKIPYQDVHEVAKLFPIKSRYGEKAQRYLTDADGFFSTIPMHGGQYRIVYGSLDKYAQPVELKGGEKKTLTLKR